MANLRPIVTAWIKKIELAWQAKKSEFQDDADEAMMFYNSKYDEWLYGGGKYTSRFADDETPPPSFRCTINKAAELVQLFGPALYHQNPVRKVNPRTIPEMPPDVVQVIMQQFPDPQSQMTLQGDLMQEQTERASDKARAILLEEMLNYTPLALDLKEHSRKAIEEALIKGAGLLYTETYTPPGAQTKMVGSFHDTIDNLVIDPDAECLDDAKWVARRCCHPYWEVEREYGLEPGSLRGKATLESQNSQASMQAVNEARKKSGKTNDLLVYWKVYSKMGVGGLLSGVAPEYTQGLEAFGDYVYLVVCEACEYPLNLPPPLDALVMAGEPAGTAEAAERLNWPTPFWADGGWPFTMIAFHWVPKKTWPMSHLKPAMGELRFINWAYSMLLQKIKVACRDFIAILKSASEDLRERIKHGADYTVIEVEQMHGSIDSVVKFLQHPGFNPEIYTVIQGVMEMFERRTGLSELLYGVTPRQIRSAQEAQMKGDFASIRPDDMAARVEDGMTQVARMEALASRWHLVGQDVAPRLGPLGMRWWDLFVTPSDPARILHQLEYRIEAGTARKPNKAAERENMQQASQTLQPLLWQYAQATGDTIPFNAITKAWAKSVDLDVSEFLLPEMPPPMPAAPQPGGGEAPPEGGGPPPA